MIPRGSAGLKKKECFKILNLIMLRKKTILLIIVNILADTHGFGGEFFASLLLEGMLGDRVKYCASFEYKKLFELLIFQK